MSRSLLAPALAFLLLAAPATLVHAQDDEAKQLLALGEEAEKAKLDDAVATYRKLLQKFPNSPQAARAHLRLGLCFAKLGKSEDARAHLRDARRLGKDDDEVQREAEKALIALPPPPEPKKEQPKTDQPKAEPKPAAPAPAPETGPRAELQAEIDKLETEKRELTKKAQDLEDAGKTADAYQVRAQLDKKVAEIEKKKKELAGMPRGGKPMLPGREQKREEKKAERKAEREEKAADKSKLMLHRKEDFEAAARTKLQDALAALAQNRAGDAAVAFGEFHRLRREADQLGKKAAEAPKDRVGAELERLTADLKRRGAASFEIEERVAFAKREFQLEEEHRQAVAAVQKDIDEKKISDAEGRERTTRLEREHHKKIERLRDDAEARVHERGRAEMEKELVRRAEELRKNGSSDAEVDQKIAALRREMEPKIPGRKLDAGTKLGETAAEPDHRQKVKELLEENKRLKKRVDELEKENATLKGVKKSPADASANPN